MHVAATRTIALCAIGVAALAGCASSSPSSSAAASAGTQSSVQLAKVTAVETTAVVDRTESGTTSGGSTAVTKASGGPSALTVQFNDGHEGRYIIENPSKAHTVGEQVYVITAGDRTAIMPTK